MEAYLSYLYAYRLGNPDLYPEGILAAANQVLKNESVISMAQNYYYTTMANIGDKAFKENAADHIAKKLLSFCTAQMGFLQEVSEGNIMSSLTHYRVKILLGKV